MPVPTCSKAMPDADAKKPDMKTYIGVQGICAIYHPCVHKMTVKIFCSLVGSREVVSWNKSLQHHNTIYLETDVCK